MRGHIHEGRTRIGQALALPESGDFRVERSVALEAAGGLAYWQADMDSAQRYYDECLELTRQIGDKKALADALYNAAFPNIVRMADMRRPRQLLEEALPQFRELGDRSGEARTLWALGNGNYFERRYPEALEMLEGSQKIFRTIDDRFGLAWSLHTTGLVALKMGNIERARKTFLEAVGLFEEANDISGMVLQLDNLSQVIRVDGDPYGATRLASAGKAHQATTGTSLGTLLSEQEGRTGREGLSQDIADRAWAEGQSLPLEEALAEAIAIARKPLTTAPKTDG
jgi:tetratricopeptide (TPR) repeat protein